MRFPDRQQLAGAARDSQLAPTIESEGEVLDLLFYLRLFLMHWWILVPVTAGGVLCAYLFCSFASPVYRAKCRFETVQDRRLDNDYGAISMSRMNDNLRRHILLMDSRALNKKVRKTLDAKWASVVPEGYDGPELTFRTVRESDGRMVDIYVDSFSALYSLEYLKLLVSGYQQLRKEEFTAMNESTVQGLRVELESLNGKLETVQREIFDFERDHNLLLREQMTERDKAMLNTLMMEINRLRVESTALESQFPFLRTLDPATLSQLLEMNVALQYVVGSGSGSGEDGVTTTTGGAERPSVTSLWFNQADWQQSQAASIRLRARYEKERTIFRDTHPKMIGLRRELEEAEDELKVASNVILNKLTARHRALEMQRAALTETAKTYHVELELTPEERFEYDQMKLQESQIKWLQNKTYTTIFDTMSTAVDPHFSRYVEEPTELAIPVWPVPWKIMAAGAGGASMLSFALVLVLYIFKRRLYDFKPLEEQFHVHCLGGIPRFAAHKSIGRSTQRIVVDQGVHELANECFRSLRQNIDLKIDGGNLLLVSSADAGEGKTFVTVNLANVYSWSFKRVLVIDGDIARQTMLAMLAPEIRRPDGLVDCLADGRDWRSLVIETGISGLDLLPAGSRLKNAAELLNTATCAELFAEIKATYDMVIVDTPPANRVVDATILARHCDAVVVVAGAGDTTAPAFRFCLSRLAPANIVGYTLNNIDASSYKYCYYCPSTTYQAERYQYGYDYRPYGGADNTPPVPPLPPVDSDTSTP